MTPPTKPEGANEHEHLRARLSALRGETPARPLETSLASGPVYPHDPFAFQWGGVRAALEAADRRRREKRGGRARAA